MFKTPLGQVVNMLTKKIKKHLHCVLKCATLKTIAIQHRGQIC